MTNRTHIEFEMPDLTDNDPAAEAVLQELAEVHQPISWRELRPLMKGLSRTRRQALLARLIGEERITWTCLRPGADVVMINSRPILERGRMIVSAVRSLVTAGALAASRVRFMPDTPAELARKFEPGFRVTPTIRLLSDVAVRSVIDPDQRDVVTTPPRTGKSRLLAVWTTVWARRRSPDTQVVLVSYSDELAQAHSREARALIQEHVAALGIQLAADKSAVGRWRVKGRRGGLLATGINSGVTGFGADVLILDDVVKDAAEADSAAHRRRVVNEYRSTLATRVHPGGSVLLVMTRWHERDLAGELLAAEPDVWTHTNVPAVAEAGVPDALRRESGVAMVSALGYTAEHFTAQRRTSGERAWAALYLGMPSAPSGGLIRRD